ncbi:MAG: helix-turn-helix domain-containing protein [Gemmatimonadales bacterium]|nr:helix-turn-helix domain-containing protein [Gemmatimonadales bacterium]
MNDRLFTAAELARHLGISEVTAWRYGRTGAINSIRVGRGMRFRETDVLEFEEKNRNRPVPRRRSGAA